MTLFGIMCPKRDRDAQSLRYFLDALEPLGNPLTRQSRATF
jgi:hypothetical protein